MEYINDTTIPEKTLRFSRQVNYPDLAYNIRLLIETYREQDKLAEIEGLKALDYAYQGASKTYLQFSKKYRDIFITIRKEGRGE